MWRRPSAIAAAAPKVTFKNKKQRRKITTMTNESKRKYKKQTNGIVYANFERKPKDLRTELE